MCSPSGRCYSDSKSKAQSLRGRIAKNYEKLADNTKKLQIALANKSFAMYEKLRTVRVRIVGYIKELTKELRYVQRDIDGTKKGRQMLEEQIANTNDPAVVVELQARIRQAEAIKFQRLHAYQYEVEGRTPLLRSVAA